MRLYIVAWRAYGEWKATSPFRSTESAQSHIDKVLLRKDIVTGEVERDYNVLCQIIPIDVSEIEVNNPHADFGHVQGENLAGNGTTDGLPAASDAEAAASIK